MRFFSMRVSKNTGGRKVPDFLKKRRHFQNNAGVLPKNAVSFIIMPAFSENFRLFRKTANFFPENGNLRKKAGIFIIMPAFSEN
jgi:hypothetical protein